MKNFCLSSLFALGYVILLYSSRHATFKAAATRREEPEGSGFRRATLIHQPAIDSYFADWLRPLLFTLEVYMETRTVAIGEAKDFNFGRSDIVLVVQRVYHLKRQKDVSYWFLNTEGPDKNYAEEAIQSGFVDIIDYSLSNIPRLLLKGAQRVVWLPIVFTPGVSLHVQRQDICLIGRTNTKRRAFFKKELEQMAKSGFYSAIKVREVHGWGFHRDLLSQEWALAVNLASVENNLAAPRMGLDVLWQYDIPIVSEEVHLHDSLEYLNTITFVPRERPVDTTLRVWASVVQSYKTQAERVEDYKLRVQVQQRRERQFKKTLSLILGRTSDRTRLFPSIVHNCSLGEDMKEMY